MRKPIRYCKDCGSEVAYRLPDDGDTKPRAVCTGCHAVHYENPINVVGTVPHWEDKVLLCKRNIEPRKGKWTLPAGFMELGETTEQGALREMVEEAGAQAQIQPLFAVLNVVPAGQVHFFYRAQLLNTEFTPCPSETMEICLFAENEIPWDEIAFDTVKQTLKYYFADYHRGSYGFHTVDIG